MPRYKLTIEYDGRPYAGWQRQDNAPSVQAALEAAAAALDEAPVTVFGAGRTDAGVHALGQVAHLDLVKDLATDTVRDAINHHLGSNPVAVLSAERADDDFHARFDATERRYLYRIVNRRAPLTFETGLAWRVAIALNAGAMHEAARVLVGRHDFTTFRDAQCQAKSPIKTLDRLDVSRRGEVIEIVCAARSFLHRQVRSMTGALVEVGRGKLSAQGLAQMLKAKDRAACAPVAPPDGLYLEAVGYGAQCPPEGWSEGLQDEDL